MIQRLLFVILVFLFAVTNVSCYSNSGNRKIEIVDSTTINQNKYLTITKVVDGDTFWIDNGTEKGEKIRLIGIDAPESRNVAKKKKGYYGEEAKEYLTNLLKDKKVRLEYDVMKTDRYGRTLAYAYLENGTFINAELVKNGYAVIMTLPPNVKFADEFVKLQQEARKNNRGLWNEP